MDTARAALGTLAQPGPGVVIETSGTTAEPKRVRLSAAALRASAEAVHERLGGPGQWLLALPTSYVAGANVLVRSALAESEPVVLAPGAFTASACVAAVEQMTGPRRYTALVPVQLARLIEGAQYDDRVRASIATLDAILVGGQASGEQQLERARKLGWNVVVTYGSTETCGGAVYDGVPLRGVEVRIEAGEIWIGGATLADNYENANGSVNHDLTDARFVERDDQRWYRTDDAGHFDDAGMLHVTGRRDRVIISGGVKVSLVAIEDVVRAMPGVSDVLATSVNDPEWGQRPVLGVEMGVGKFGETGPGASLSEHNIRDAIEATLGKVSVPDHILFGPLPRNANGKPDGRGLVERLRG